MTVPGHAVPKFGSWDAENIGYTVFFEKVRENKGAPVPPSAASTPKASDDDYAFDPFAHYEHLSRNVPPRPPSSHGRGATAKASADDYAFDPYAHYESLSKNAPPSSHGHGHRRMGSSGSATSEGSSKFSPPKPYQPRYANYPAAHQGTAAPAPRPYQYAAPKVAASPPRHVPPPARATKPSAVPKFGVWDEQNATAAAQGFTVQFEKVKRHREVAKVVVPEVPPERSPERAEPAYPPRRKTKANKSERVEPALPPRRKAKARRSFMSKLYRCMFPRVRE